MFLAVKLTTFQAIMDKTGWTGYNVIHCGKTRLTNMIGCRCGFRFSKFSIIAMVVTVEMRNLVDCSQTRWTQQNVTVHNRPQNLEVVHNVMGNIYNASHGLYKFCYILLRIMRVLSSFVNCFVTIPVTIFFIVFTAGRSRRVTARRVVLCPVPVCEILERGKKPGPAHVMIYATEKVKVEKGPPSVHHNHHHLFLHISLCFIYTLVCLLY